MESTAQDSSIKENKSDEPVGESATGTMAKTGDDGSPELRQFEDLTRRAIELGFTVLLNFQRFHPVHTERAPACRSGVELVLVPILEHTREQFGGNRTLWSESILVVLEQGWRIIDRYAAGERFAAPIRPRQRRQSNLSDEERERRRQRMLDYWNKKRGQGADV